jgi:hypothetical protein
MDYGLNHSKKQFDTILGRGKPLIVQPLPKRSPRTPTTQPHIMQPPTSRKYSFIFDLPPEMIDEIMSHLPIVSRACLVLSCKKFYHKFNFVLADFKWPYFDGPDECTDISSRTQLLVMFESQQWKFCAACLNLHPPSDFDQDAPGYDDATRRTCKWPGVIVLCPCLKFRSKYLSHLTSLASLTKSGRIPDWHQCEFVSPYGELSYKLNISLSVDWKGWVGFRFRYTIKVDRMKYHGAKCRIMLCPHMDALKCIRLKDRAYFLISTMSMECNKCSISPYTSLAEDLTTYEIWFGRELSPHQGPRMPGSPFNDRKWDYNWRR